MTVGQLALFDLDEAEETPEPPHSPPRIDGECKHCGEPVSSRSPMDSVNHGTYGETCVTRQLSRMHALNSQRRLEPDGRRDDERCMKHQARRISCSQVCWQVEYDNYAARATEAWSGDEWKEPPP